MKKRKTNVDGESSKRTELEEILENLPSDPARQKRILDYDPNIRDQALMNQKHHLESAISRQVEASKQNYYTHLNASIDCVPFLLRVKAVAFDNTPGNVQLKSPAIQKDILNTTVVETLNAIMFDMSNAPFSILVDEARDSSVKEQINGLSISNLRGQGYDGASNMQVTKVVNLVGGSCKRRDLLREQQQNELIDALQNNELPSGRGLNQETTLKRTGDTRWGSHYGTLLSIISMFSSTVKVIEMISEDGTNADQRGKCNLLRNDQDIVNVMDLVKASKQQLQRMRKEEWLALRHLGLSQNLRCFFALFGVSYGEQGVEEVYAKEKLILVTGMLRFSQLCKEY
ncbi:uncharacterized protein LOC126795369 [Argentina anserina]|uniref:uncharacterized protein LOC126795369 n=1 Tax=Argentina anserina TaxID=57926 RepID=UPI0021767F19|nr:uncharacterized protein LOC126795369 [Potentilla anserina]